MTQIFNQLRLPQALWYILGYDKVGTKLSLKPKALKWLNLTLRNLLRLIWDSTLGGYSNHARKYMGKKNKIIKPPLKSSLFST